MSTNASPIHLDHPLARWDLPPREAIALQRAWAARVIEAEVPAAQPIRRVAGTDVGFEDGGAVTRAAVVVLDAASGRAVDHALVRRPTTFPYVPGLLSFRELPALLDAFAALETLPDLIHCDGHGRAHPRRFGLACHLGLLLDRPTIGVAKSRLTGRHGALPDARGDWCPLLDGRADADAAETIGAVVRSRARVKPIYVSIGHRVTLASAVRDTMRFVGRFKLPETTRAAHRLASHGVVPR
ncbi:MAG: deoxyribonuclease V [Acidobacteriota bacterium]